MPNNILITPGSASIQFSGSAANTIRLQVENSGSIAFYGNSGSLFGITDSLSGSLMSVNDISGLPILEVFSDDRVVMGSFNKNTLVVTGSRVGIDKANPTTDLDISGSVFITGSLRMSSGGITGSLFGTSSLATTSSYVSPSGLPTGTVSSSIQINTGSFSGSFTGTLIGTSSWADNTTSASFATTSSAADSITFVPATASFATSASYALSASYAPSAPSSGVTSLTAGDGLTGGIITSTGTITLDTGSVHFLDGVKKELNTEGVVSSSTQVSYTGLSNVPSGIVSSSSQINTGSFTGSFTGDGSGLIGVVVSTFPYTGSAIISGSLRVTGSTVNSGSVLVTSGDLTLTNATQTTLNYTQGANSAFVRLTSTEFRLGSVSNQGISFLQNGVVAWYIDTSKNLVPNVNNTYDIGLTGQRVRTIWTTNISSSTPIASASYALSATSASYALSASYAPSAPGSGVTSITAGDGLDGGVITTTGTISLNTGSVHFLDGVKKELNTENVISSSLQFNTVTTPFTGSFTGSFTGALTHFNPTTLKLTVGTTAPASPSINDLWVDTN